jgi:hypothetical protein
MIRRLHILIVLIALAGAAGCEPQYTTGWDALHAGMTRDEVRELLGPPRNSGLPPLDEASGEPVTRGREWWSYGVSGLIGMRAAMDGISSAGPQPDAHVVWFDEHGRVIAWDEPLE